jgi:hypothetical protein
MRANRTLQELKETSKHLHYEFWMLCEVVSVQRRGSPTVAINNALLESVGVHARVLLHFLYDEQPRTDDVVASDYISNWHDVRPKKTEFLDRLSARVGKEIAHLTYARLHVEPSLKGWDSKGIACAIDEVLGKFLRLVPHDLLDDIWDRNLPMPRQ